MRKLKVLVVDDSPEDIKLATALLEKAGHGVLTAANGVEGVAVAQKEKPDLILMDVVMPELNGFQATRQLSKNAGTSNIPVIVVSGKDEETDKAWAMRQGARAYLTKALEPKTLLETINRVMA
jgi:twitching motility two-component system response regulator PilH